MSYTNQCPLLEECQQSVYEPWFRIVCRSIRWVYCKHAKEKAKEHSHNPKEWLRLMFEEELPAEWLKGKHPPENEKREETEDKEKKKRKFPW